MVKKFIEEIYVTYTCKNPKCQKAFLDLDPYGIVEDEPLETRYCPECVAKGFKNSAYLRYKPRTKSGTPYKKPLSFEAERKNYFKKAIKEDNITDEKLISIIWDEYLKGIRKDKELNKRICLKNIFKRAKEIASYY